MKTFLRFLCILALWCMFCYGTRIIVDGIKMAQERTVENDNKK